MQPKRVVSIAPFVMLRPNLPPLSASIDESLSAALVKYSGSWTFGIVEICLVVKKGNTARSSTAVAFGCIKLGSLRCS